MGLAINSCGGMARVGGWKRGNHILAPCSIIANHRQTASLIKMRITFYLSISLFMFSHVFRIWGKMDIQFAKYLGSLLLI